MIPKPLRKFIEDLREASDNRDIEWQEGAPDAYYCNHKNVTLHIAHYVNEDIGQGYFLFRMVSKGNTTSFSVTDNEEDYQEISALYSSVMANAANVQEIIQGFFEP